MIPEKLYKYEPFTDLTLRNLKKQSIYFSSPAKFNDPYDCAINAGIKELTDMEIDGLRSETKEDVGHLTIDNLREIITRTTKEFIENQRTEFKEKIGITCLSENNDDLIMWAHYGGRYRGFCLEFDTKFEPFNKAKKVKYSKTLPSIDPIPSLRDLNGEQFIELLLLKSKSWKYEKEWRILHKVSDILYVYPRESLTAIYFGPNMERENLEIIALIIAGQNPEVKLFKGKLSKTSFKVEFEPFHP